MPTLVRILVLVAFFPFALKAQTFSADSLSRELRNTTDPLRRVDLLNKLSYSYYDYDVNKGFEYSSEAFALSSEKNYGPGMRQALTLKGYYYHSVGDYNTALSFYRQSAALNVPQDWDEGYNLVMMGNVFLAVASYDSAIWYYNQGIEILRKVKAHSHLAFAFRNMGKVHLLRWENREAMLYFDKALSIYEILKSSYGKAEVYFLMADLNKNLGDYRKSASYTDHSCELAEQLNDDYLRLFCLINQGEIQQGMGAFLQALETLLQAVDLLKRQDNPKTLARLYTDLGNVYESLSQNDVALRYYFEALKISEQLGFKYEIASLHSHIAWIYKNQENFESAFEFIEKSLKLRESIRDKFGIADAYNVKGIIFLQQKKFDEAIDWLDRSLELRQDISYREGVASCWYNMALVYEAQKEYDKALDFHQRSLIMERSIGNQYNTGIGYNSVGSVFTDMGEFDSAAYYLKIAAELGRKTGAISLQMENSLYWSELFEKQGKQKEALAWHKKYAALNDSIYDENSATKLAEMQALYQTDQKDKEIRLLSQDKLLQSNQIQLQETRIEFQSYIIAFVILALVLVSLLAYKTYGYNREIKKAHDKISHQKEEIQSQAEELQKAYTLIAGSNRELEAKVKERTSELSEAYRELDTFFYRASHDFRRPLTTFLGLVEVADITVSDPNARDLFSRVRETATSLDRMLSKQQSISHFDSELLRKGEVDLEELVKALRVKFSDDFREKKIKFLPRVEGTTSVLLFPSMVKVILENLVENAVHFCAPEKAFIRVSARCSQDSLVLEIEDNGEGIQYHFQEQIFDMFFRASERSRGNGLGLYIVKKAVDRLHGRVCFSSVPGSGSIFHVTLPVEELHAQAVRTITSAVQV